MTSNSTSSNFSPFSEYHPAWEGKEFSKDEFAKTVEDLASKESTETFIVQDHTVTKAPPLVRIWNIVKGWFGFENRTDPVKVNYELLKLLRYAETHHFLDNEKIKISLRNLVNNFRTDSKYTEIADIYDEAINSQYAAEHIAKTNDAIKNYYSKNHTRLHDSFWTKIFHEFITPVKTVSAANYTNLARMHFFENRYPQALTSIDNAIEIEAENSPERLLLRAEILFHKAGQDFSKNPDSALESYENACEAFSEIPQEAFLGREDELNRMRHNLHIMAAALSVKNNFIDNAIEYLGLLKDASGNYPTADLENIIDHNKLLEDQPLKFGAFLLDLSEHANIQKNSLQERALNLLSTRSLENATPQLKEKIVRAGLGLAKLSEDKLEEQYSYLSKISTVAINAKNTLNHDLKNGLITEMQHVAKHAVTVNDNIKAKALLERANELDPDNLKTIKALTKLLMAEKDFNEADKLNKSLLVLDPENIKHYLRGVEIQEQLNRKTNAIKLLEAAMKVFPDNLDLIAIHYRLTGKISGQHVDKALEAGLKIAEDNKSDYQIRLSIANIYLQKNQLDNARKYLLEAQRILKNRKEEDERALYSDILKSLATIATEQKNIPEAKKLYQELIECSKDDPEIKSLAAENLFKLALIALEAKAKGEALLLFREVYELIKNSTIPFEEDPLKKNLANIYNQLGNQATKTTQKESAYIYFEKAYTLGSKDSTMLEFMAKHYNENNNTSEARRVYQLLAINPSVNSWVSEEAKAYAALIDTRFTDALQHFISLSKEFPHNETWKQNISRCHVNIAINNVTFNPAIALDNFIAGYPFANDEQKAYIRNCIYDLGINLANTVPSGATMMAQQGGYYPQPIAYHHQNQPNYNGFDQQFQPNPQYFAPQFNAPQAHHTIYPNPLYPSPTAPPEHLEADDFASTFPTYGTTMPNQQPAANVALHELSIKALLKVLEWINEAKTTAEENDRLFAIHYSLAKSAIAIGKNNEAIIHFENAHKHGIKYPEFANAYTKLLKETAYNALRDNKYADVKTNFRKILELNELDESLRNEYVSLLERMGRAAVTAENFKEARIHFEEALKIHREANLLIQYGFVLEKLKETHNAILHYKEAEKNDPSLKGNVARLEQSSRKERSTQVATKAAEKEQSNDLLEAYNGFIEAHKLIGDKTTYTQDILRLALKLGNRDFDKGEFNPEKYRKEVVDFVQSIVTGPFSNEITVALGRYRGANSSDNVALRAQGQNIKTPREILEHANRAIALVKKAYSDTSKPIPWKISEACDRLMQEMNEMKQYYATMSDQVKLIVETVRNSDEASRFDPVLLKSNYTVQPDLTGVEKLLDSSNILFVNFSRKIDSLPAEKQKVFAEPMAKLSQSLRRAVWYQSALQYYDEAFKINPTDILIVNRLIACNEFIGRPFESLKLFYRYAALNGGQFIQQLNFEPYFYLQEANKFDSVRQKPSIEIIQLYLHAAYGYTKPNHLNIKTAIECYVTAIRLIDQNPSLYPQNAQLIKNGILGLTAAISQVERDPNLVYPEFEKERILAYKQIIQAEASTHQNLVYDADAKAGMLSKLGLNELSLNNIVQARNYFNLALKNNPKQPEAFEGNSKLDFAEGKYEELQNRLTHFQANNYNPAWVMNLKLNTDLELGRLAYASALYGQILVHLRALQELVQRPENAREIRNELSGLFRDWWTELLNLGKVYNSPQDILAAGERAEFLINYANNNIKSTKNAGISMLCLDRLALINNLIRKIPEVEKELPVRVVTLELINKGATNNFQTAINLGNSVFRTAPQINIPYLSDARAGL